MKKNILIALFSLPIIFSCSEKEQKNSDTDIIEYNEDTSNEKNKKTPETISHIVIKADDNMMFDKTNFTVKAGEEITLLLVNAGSLSKEAMGHNVVILNQGTDTNSFALAASSEKSNDYIPTTKQNEIIAHTKLLGSKESDQIKFKIDQPGTYDFICSFPGHAATMKGTITVIN